MEMEIWEIVHRIAICGLVLLVLPFPIVLLATGVAWVVGGVAAIGGFPHSGEVQGADRGQPLQHGG